ncbi:MAG: ABC transporter substrate-binding protein [Pseudomonadota bacterium]
MTHPRIGRRAFLATALGGAGLAVLPALRLARVRAQAKRSLTIDTLASVAAINVPMQQVLNEGLGEQPGFTPAQIQRNEHMPMGIQSVVSGTTDMGDGDVPSILRAAEAGADVRILGLSYNNTSQAIVVNGDRLKTLEELQKPNITIAVNSAGDFMHVILIGTLLKHKIDPTKVTVVEIGGSVNRTRALLAGKVDAATIHIEQAGSIAERGNFQILVRPWQEYPAYFSAAIFATESWLQKPGNRPAALAFVKATLIAFRKTNADFAWYEEKYRKYNSSKEARTAPTATIQETWRLLRDEVKGWPDDMETLTVENFVSLKPAYQAAGAIKGTVDFAKLVDRSILDQALAELHRRA